jgi:hypothetical protein
VGGHGGGGGGGARPELVWSIAHGPWSWSIITYRPLYFTPIACCIELPIELPIIVSLENCLAYCILVCCLLPTCWAFNSS